MVFISCIDARSGKFSNFLASMISLYLTVKLPPDTLYGCFFQIADDLLLPAGTPHEMAGKRVRTFGLLQKVNIVLFTDSFKITISFFHPGYEALSEIQGHGLRSAVQFLPGRFHRDHQV